MELKERVSRDAIMQTITSDSTHHSFGHNATYARATTGTEENFILEYVILENSRRLNNGVNNPIRLRHFEGWKWAWQRYSTVTTAAGLRL
jgi:hypothetical protein